MSHKNGDPGEHRRDTFNQKETTMQHQYEIYAWIGDDFHETLHHVRGTYRESMKELRSRKYPGTHIKILEKNRI